MSPVTPLHSWSWYPFVGDRQPRTIPTKDLPHQVAFWQGVARLVCEVLEPKKKGKVRTRDVDCRFCGGGARIARSDFGHSEGKKVRKSRNGLQGPLGPGVKKSFTS